MKLSETLGIPRGVTSVIGSGGKTTLLHVLAKELCTRGTVILTTSTHMYPSRDFPCLYSPSEEQIKAALQRTPVLCVGSLTDAGKLTACALPFPSLAALADFVLVEADGSKGLPLKAHAAHEPVIPENSEKIVCVVGASGLGKKISQAVHRPQRFCDLAGASEQDAATPNLVAAVLKRENLADIYYINQCDLPEAAAQAAALAPLLPRPTVCGSLRRLL